MDSQLRRFQHRHDDLPALPKPFDHDNTAANRCHSRAANGLDLTDSNGYKSTSSSQASTTMLCEPLPRIGSALPSPAIATGNNVTPTNTVVNSNSNLEEMAFLRKTIEEKEQSLRSVVEKLQNLQTHYSELHSAYTAATKALQNATPSEHIDQISKLQTALNVAINEKTAYQTELRVLNGKVTTLENENSIFKEQIKSATNYSAVHEAEKSKLKNEIEQLARSLKQSIADVERERRENAVLDSKMRQVHQDRSDIQSRLKYVFHEKEELEKAYAAVKHDLQMKEIFIRQLTFGESDASSSQAAFENITHEKDRLAAEVSQLHATAVEGQRLHAAAVESLEACVARQNADIKEIEHVLSETKNEKAYLETAKVELEVKIEELSAQLVVYKAAHPPAVFEAGAVAPVLQRRESQIDPMEIEALKNSLTALQQDLSRSNDRIRELELLAGEKEMIIENLERTLSTEQQRAASLKTDIETQQTIQTDVHSLLDQLQNEKATVSRAIAQNLELKEQLGELQDKFVEVTNESAIREDQRTTAMVTIDRLQKQMDDLILERNSPKLESSKTVEHAETQTADIQPEAPVEALALVVAPEKMDNEQQTDFTFAKTIALEASAATAEVVENVVSNKNGENLQDSSISTVSDDITQLEHRSESSITESDSSDVSLTNNGTSPGDSDISNKSINGSNAVTELESRIESLVSEKKAVEEANAKLQYFLTALESENESIGEYIALYRFQRSNIQKKVAEKDALIGQLAYEKTAAQKQINELQQVLWKLLGQSPEVLKVENAEPTENGDANGTTEGTVNGETNPMLEKLNLILHEIQHRPHVCQNPSAVTTDFTDPKLHCPECRGQMFTC